MKIPKTPKSRYVLAALALLIAGTAAFAIGRYVASEDAPIQAQEGRDETPVPGETPEIIYLASPHPDVLAMETAIAEDNAKPLFAGELNGITFVGEGTPFPSELGTPMPSEQAWEACSRESVILAGEEARVAADDSDLDFRVSEVPSGLKLVEESTTLCMDEVLHIGRLYSDDADENTRRLSIQRTKRLPEYPALAPEDRMEPTTIGGRRAVIVESIFGLDLTRIIMYDDEETLWTIIAERIDEDDAIEVAEGID